MLCGSCSELCSLWLITHLVLYCLFKTSQKHPLFLLQKPQTSLVLTLWPATSHSRPSSCPVTAVSLTPLQVHVWLTAESNQTGSPSEKGQEVISPFFFFWEVSVYMQRDQYKTNQSPPQFLCFLFSIHWTPTATGHFVCNKSWQVFSSCTNLKLIMNSLFSIISIILTQKRQKTTKPKQELRLEPWY